MQSNLLKNLYKQLCDFGLNSKEWIIRPVSKNYYLIYHNEDPNFKFMGQTDRHAWSQIWLESI